MPSPKGKSPLKIGIDIGGVIIQPARASGDTSFFSSGYLDTPVVDGAFAAIAELNTHIFPNNVFLVSKAKSGTAQKTREWLAHKSFYQSTGIMPDKLFFCDKREGKVPIAKRLGLSIFIDDRVDVLGHLVHIPHRILFADSLEWQTTAVPETLKPVIGWAQTLEHLRAYV